MKHKHSRNYELLHNTNISDKIKVAPIFDKSNPILCQLLSNDVDADNSSLSNI